MKKLILVFGLFAISPLFAQERDWGWYLGVGAGVSDLGVFDNSSMVEAYGGYNVGRFFALEGGYLELGEFDFDENNLIARTDASGWKLIALGKIPLSERFSIYGGGGALFSEVEKRVGGTTDKDSDTGIAIEAGVQVRFTDRWSLDVEYGRYVLEVYAFTFENGNNGIIVDNDNTESDVFKLALSYRF